MEPRSASAPSVTVPFTLSIPLNDVSPRSRPQCSLAGDDAGSTERTATDPPTGAASATVDTPCDHPRGRVRNVTYPGPPAHAPSRVRTATLRHESATVRRHAPAVRTYPLGVWWR
ncbi:hypothetical protein GCM10023175_03520 [Pseudonocardia xishanensis]|uniref:Uncharacterized protein n=1 Tax=Pseudonocardia xishanensis TaxID=630995 RepID=A0ABP8RED3_9PSEU